MIPELQLSLQKKEYINLGPLSFRDLVEKANTPIRVLYKQDEETEHYFNVSKQDWVHESQACTLIVFNEILVEREFNNSHYHTV